MADADRSSPHDDLVRRLFHLLTARFEDGAGIAAEGQRGGIAPDIRIEQANRLHSMAQEAMILADAVIALSSLEITPAKAID